MCIVFPNLIIMGILVNWTKKLLWQKDHFWVPDRARRSKYYVFASSVYFEKSQNYLGWTLWLFSSFTTIKRAEEFEKIVSGLWIESAGERQFKEAKRKKKDLRLSFCAWCLFILKSVEDYIFTCAYCWCQYAHTN